MLGFSQCWVTMVVNFQHARLGLLQGLNMTFAIRILGTKFVDFFCVLAIGIFFEWMISC